jgi:hypothetical protein
VTISPQKPRPEHLIVLVTFSSTPPAGDNFVGECFQINLGIRATG